MQHARVRGSLLSLAFVVHASAAATQERPTYTERVFTTADGLPSQAITQVAQTGDGYLWVLAGGLLSRFDGKEFRSYTAANAPLFERRLMVLSAGLGDTLWIVDEGNALFAMSQGKVTRIAPPGPRRITSIVQRASGELYAGASPDVVRLRRDRGVWELARANAFGMSRGTEPLPLLRDLKGGIWSVDAAAVLRRVDRDATDARQTLGRYGALLSGVSGSVLSVRKRAGNREVVEANGDVVARYRESAGAQEEFLDREGRLWVALPNSYQIYERGSESPVAVLARGSPLAKLFVGSDGCVWETGLALRQICLAAFRTRSLPVGSGDLDVGPNASVLRRNSEGVTMVVRADGEPQPLSRRRDLVLAFAHRDQRGAIWWSAFPDPQRQAEANDRGQPLPPERSGGEDDGRDHILPHRRAYVFADHKAFPDVIWYAADGFLFRSEAHGSRQRRVTDSVVVQGLVTSLSAAADGSAWAIVKTQGASSVVHVSQSTVEHFAAGEGIPAVSLRVIRAMDDGAVWVGTYGAGLVRIKERRVRVVATRDGLAENVVTSLLRDEAGNLWMGGNQSIHRVSIRELSEFLDGARPKIRGVGYGQADGIEVTETVGSSGVVDDNGRLWMPTIAGAVIVDPRLAIALDSVAPAIRINEVVTASDSLPWSRSPVRLTRGARRIIVRYAGVTMRNANRVRYEYRLEGVDKEWIDAGPAREALYTTASPGTHIFRVRAISAAGVPTPNEATLAIVVPAYFAETPTFYILLIVGAGLLLWVTMRARERAHFREAAVLTRAVEERTASLAHALSTVGEQAAQLRTLDEAKSRFFANVSHEFRTPLSLILGPVEDLREGRFGQLGPTVLRRLDGVHTSAQRLLRLVDQLLDVARLQAGALKLAAKEQDLVPLLRRMADSFSSFAERKGIAFRLSCPVAGLIVSCDADQMEKVVANLVGNALKFTGSGGSVELVATLRAAESVAVIEVVDTGPGIAPEFHDRVFHRFFQVDDSTTRAHEGTGIGLALVRELVEMHGGTVRLDSALGAGSRFTVQLPLATVSTLSGTEKRRHTPDAPPAVHKRPVPQPRARDLATDAVTVLLVEDNAELLEYLREHLAARFRVLVAENGLRGLEMAREYVPDLIVSDLMMPELDGQALCEAVKGDPDIDFIPVVLLTAKASRESRLTGLALGADDYLTKPVDLPELIIRAENLIASRRHVRERLRALDQQLPTIRVPLAAPPRDASERAIVDTLSQVLANHLADVDFDVPQLASKMSMSRTTLYRKLTPLLGMSPIDYVREYRLAQAAQWLAETSITVSEVAYGVGFKSVPHFSVSFRDRYGESPTAYRQARRSVASM